MFSENICVRSECLDIEVALGTLHKLAFSTSNTGAFKTSHLSHSSFSVCFFGVSIKVGDAF